MKNRFSPLVDLKETLDLETHWAKVKGVFTSTCSWGKESGTQGMDGQIRKDYIPMASGWRGAAPIRMGSGSQKCNAETGSVARVQKTYGGRRTQMVGRQLARTRYVWKATARRGSPDGEERMV